MSPTLPPAPRALLAITVPTYNRVDLLLELLASVPAGTAVHVSDNGGFFSRSTGPERIATTVSVSPTESVVPMFANWQRAAAAADADWFVIPSDDDTFCAGGVEHMQRMIERHPDVDMFVFGHNLIDGQGSRIGGWHPEKEQIVDKGLGFGTFARGVPARCPAIALKTETYRRLGGFDDHFRISAADSWLIQKMSLNGKLLFDPTVVANYRIWPDSFTSTQLAGPEWMTDVIRWMRLLHQELRRLGHSPADASRTCDEIIVDNLVAGLKGRQSRKRVALKLTLAQYGLPWRIRPVTLARLVKALAVSTMAAAADLLKAPKSAADRAG